MEFLSLKKRPTNCTIHETNVFIDKFFICFNFVAMALSELQIEAQLTRKQGLVSTMLPEIPVLDLPAEDGEPLEDVWHRIQINLLIDCVKTDKSDHSNYFVGGNMFVYYSLQQIKNQDYKGPDFFYVEGVDGNHQRSKWIVWEEGGRYPDIIIELLSPSTQREDLGRKKDVYERVFRTGEYFCFNHDEKKLYGWRLINSKYQAIEPDDKGLLSSGVLGYKLGLWHGKYYDEDIYLRFFKDDLSLILTEAELERARAESEKARAESEKARADRLEKELEALKGKV
jgi:Uma2 family endonuclease